MKELQSYKLILNGGKSI
ncbi:hypothetical protein Goarm_006498 [Gossypium armourianum]|uniref:Uncharacterized protein n=1 Tax=Gossypium armourianum TaxID=34283 RepID=A0A7J9JIN5_9ROSI|nr:hypothetical protein [Gossypium armourianum]